MRQRIARAGLALTLLIVSTSGCSLAVRTYKHIQGYDYCGDGQAAKVIYYYTVDGYTYRWSCAPDRWK